MFEQSYSETCKFGIKCNKILCSFQHNNTVVSANCKSTENQEMLFKGQMCEIVCLTETELGKHEDEAHEGWRLSETFTNIL